MAMNPNEIGLSRNFFSSTRQWSMGFLISPVLWVTAPPSTCWPSAPDREPSNCLELLELSSWVYMTKMLQ